MVRRGDRQRGRRQARAPHAGAARRLHLHRHRGSIDGASIWIVGDVAHSRVARSNVLAFQMMGAKVTLVGPPTLIPRGIEELGCEVRYTLDELESADIVYALRMQNERMSAIGCPRSASTPRATRSTAAARAAPDADAPRTREPRRGALRGGGRLAPGCDHRAGRGGRGRAHGGPLRAARRLARAAAPGGRAPRSEPAVGAGRRT